MEINAAFSLVESGPILPALHASLPYGYHFTGSASRVVLTPETERVILFLLQTVTQGTNTLLTGPK